MPNTWPKTQPQPQQHKHTHNRTTAARVNDITPRTDALFRLGFQWPVFMSKVFNGSNLLLHLLMDQWRSQCFMVIFLLRPLKRTIHNMSLLQRECSNVLRPAHAIWRHESPVTSRGWQAVARCFQLSKSFLRMWVNVGGLGTAACCQQRTSPLTHGHSIESGARSHPYSGSSTETCQGCMSNSAPFYMMLIGHLRNILSAEVATASSKRKPPWRSDTTMALVDGWRPRKATCHIALSEASLTRKCQENAKEDS